MLGASPQTPGIYRFGPSTGSAAFVGCWLAWSEWNYRWLPRAATVPGRARYSSVCQFHQPRMTCRATLRQPARHMNRVHSHGSSQGRGWDDETVVRKPEVVFRTPPHLTRRAVDVNPPVTMRARAANTAPATQQGRTGRLTSAARQKVFFETSSGRGG